MNFKERLNEIRAFVFDLDGVLTDGSLLIFPDSEYIRTMNIKDGYALQLAVKKGYKVAIISGGTSEAVRQRLNKLGITEVHMGVSNKEDILEEYCSRNTLRFSELIYMGDDIPDYKVMQRAGIAACPADACADIRGISLYVSPYKGGEGCARDIIEQTLRLHGNWYDDENILVRSR
jgi:3-deoxy-D-manno-octulosonate 8-phosphate phosphatase (KDO 8-P phosphatase)